MSDPESFIAPYKTAIDTAIMRSFTNAGDLPIYGMLRYFMGYEDKEGKALAVAKGKRIRSVLLLAVADMFGGSKGALDLAVAVELFHNFTLIHDDIEDHDELRRGRPTVWKIWGIDHGINSGDAQAFLTTQHLLRATLADTQNGPAAAFELNTHFLQVIEGQYLDFELTKKALGDAVVTEAAYLEMIRKKTAVLIGTAVAAGGVVVGCSKEARDSLFVYGESLGMAYQMADDMSSIWGDTEQTGKCAHGDIVECKKTYPILYARDHGANKEITDLYARKGEFSNKDVEDVVSCITKTGAREATRDRGQEYVTNAKEAVEKLPLSTKQKETLMGFVDTFVRFAPLQHASD